MATWAPKLAAVMPKPNSSMQVLSASQVGIEPANAVIAETRLRARRVPRPGSHDRLTGGIYLGRQTCRLLYLRSTHHRMRPRSVIHFWMSSATWSEFVSIIQHMAVAPDALVGQRDPVDLAAHGHQRACDSRRRGLG